MNTCEKIAADLGGRTQWQRFVYLMLDEGGFFHKTLFSIGKSAVSSALDIAVSVIPGTIDDRLLAGGRGLVDRFTGGTRTAAPARVNTPGVPGSGGRGFGGCNLGFKNRNGVCVPVVDVVPGNTFGLTDLPFQPEMKDLTGHHGDDDFGPAVNGKYGAAILPALDQTVARRCPSGSVLGDDGLCYNKGQITNSQREWPRGRQPLLTGGQMKAISTAARAAKRLETKTKQLQRMGMIRKPAPRRIKAAPAQRQLPPGTTIVQN